MSDLTHDERIRMEADTLQSHWASNARWDGIERAYSAEDVIALETLRRGLRFETLDLLPSAVRP